MNVIITIPDTILNQNQDLLSQFKGMELKNFWESCALCGLIVARNSGNHNSFRENIERMNLGKIPIFTIKI